MKTFFKIAILALHVVIVVLLLGLWLYLDVFSYITQLEWCRIFARLWTKNFVGYFLFLVVGVYLICKTIKCSSIFKHEKYLIITILFSLLVIFSPIETASRIWTTIHSVAISLLAGVVAVYSELKSKAISERKETLAEIKEFQEQVEAMIERMDHEKYENGKAALDFLRISKKQEEIREKYDKIWALKKPNPAFGDEIDIVMEIESRIEEGLNTGLSRTDWEKILESIRNSLGVTQRQINWCVERIEGEASAAEKIGCWYQKWK